MRKNIFSVSFYLTVTVIFIVLVEGCSEKLKEDNKTMAASEAPAKTDLETLKKLLLFPFKPLSSKWQVVALSQYNSATFNLGPDDWGIIALLELSSEDLEKLKAMKPSVEVVHVPKRLVPSWLTDVLNTNFTISDTQDFYVPSCPVLTAEPFFKSPLLSGSAFLVSDKQILIYLQTR